MLQPHPPLHPLLAPHLTQSTQRPRKRKPFLIPAEQTRPLHHAHAHPQVVHQVPHDVVNVRGGVGGLGIRVEIRDFAVVFLLLLRIGGRAFAIVAALRFVTAAAAAAVFAVLVAAAATGVGFLRHLLQTIIQLTPTHE